MARLVEQNMKRPRTRVEPGQKKVIYRPLSKETTFEHAVEKLFPSPAILEIELDDGRLLDIMYRNA